MARTAAARSAYVCRSMAPGCAWARVAVIAETAGAGPTTPIGTLRGSAVTAGQEKASTTTARTAASANPMPTTRGRGVWCAMGTPKKRMFVLLLKQHPPASYALSMPKVSEAHREARREEIVAAATRAFLAKGFARTSMAEVIAA